VHAAFNWERSLLRGAPAHISYAPYVYATVLVTARVPLDLACAGRHGARNPRAWRRSLATVIAREVGAFINQGGITEHVSLCLIRPVGAAAS
jgi:hypothetical protein